MSNDYFNNTGPIGRNTKARSAEIRAKHDAIAAGFDKLPSQENLHRNMANFAIATGSANTYSATMESALTSYQTGQNFRIQIPATNTGASTLNVDGQGARAIKRIDGTDVEAGDLTAGDIVDLVFNGTSMVMLGTYRSHLAGIASNLGANLVFSGNPAFSGNPVFTGAPNLNGITNKSTLRTHIGLAIGSDVQAYNAKLQSLSGLSGAADRLPYLSGASTFALATLTAAGRALLDDADAATQRVTLGLGNAATETVMSSLTDTTVDRLMKVGAFGWGDASSAVAWPNSSINDVTGVGNGIYNASGLVTDKPTGAGVVVFLRRSTGEMAQYYCQTASGERLYYRASNSGTQDAPVWSSWRLVYSQSSILGTVSQSAGVPTGAIIERGSNANGSYVRFADGTQICHARRTVTYATAQAMTTTWTFPASFASNPQISIAIDEDSFTAGSAPSIYEVVSYYDSLGLSSVRLALGRINGMTSFVSGNSSGVDALAIGRWF